MRGTWPRINQSQCSFCWVEVWLYNNLRYSPGLAKECLVTWHIQLCASANIWWIINWYILHNLTMTKTCKRIYTRDTPGTIGKIRWASQLCSFTYFHLKQKIKFNFIIWEKVLCKTGTLQLYVLHFAHMLIN